MKSFVYVIKNIVTGDVYVGKSNNPNIRWKNHVRGAMNGHDSYFANAIRKYGKDAFQIIDIKEFPSEQEAYINEEPIRKTYINAGIHTYNMCEGGRGCINPSIETREKLRNIHLGLKHSDETKAKMSESCRKICKRNKNFSDEHRAKISEAKRGKKHSPEHTAKISEARRRYFATHDVKLSAEHRMKVSEALRGKKLSDETRAKISESQKQTAKAKKVNNVR